MLTKYQLIYDNKTYTLRPEDFKNWDEVKCCYKRNEYSGIVRSLTSQFELCNGAYDIIMALFDRDGFAAKARLDLLVIDNHWVYQREFSAYLDFATLTYNKTTLTINTLDQSIAATIKANKSTKYEFVVGEDIPTCGQYMFDRVKLLETATYEVTQGESQEDGSLKGVYKKGQNNRLYTGRTGMEISNGKVLLLEEDQTNDAGSYLFKALKNCTVTFKWNIEVWRETGCERMVLMKGDTELVEITPTVVKNARWRDIIFSSEAALYNYCNGVNIDNIPQNAWVAVQEAHNRIVVYEMKHDGIGYQWLNTGLTVDEYCRASHCDEASFQLFAGDKVWIKFDYDNDSAYHILSSRFQFTWESRGKTVAIDAIQPEDLLRAILNSMAGTSHPDVAISAHDPHIANTLILAAESVRAIPGAKIYASLNDFCNWMEAVFGYTYEIDDANNTVHFLHRTEIFNASADVATIPNIVDAQYKIEQSVLYATINAGYAKKDYEGVNGRDEFNFNNTYMTGFTVSDKKLELKSPFRADSYGLEFAVQKRGEDTTDTDSDQDVFFVLASKVSGDYKPKRTATISGSISNTLLNGEFSPIYCVRNNKDYIGMIAPEMELTFASSEANSDIIINGLAMSSDLTLPDTDMLTAGELSFMCDERYMPTDFNALIEVKADGFRYRGFLKEVNRRYANPEALDMTIMIKEKTPC